MFCTKCGAKVAEGSAFCTSCGNRLAAAPAQPAQPVQAKPVQPARPAQPQPAQPAQAKPQFAIPEHLKSIKLPKIKFEKKPAGESAPEGEKQPFVNPLAGNKPLLVRVLSIVCVLLLLLSYCASVNCSVEKIPIVGLALAGSGDEMDELKDEFGDLADKMEEGMDEGEEMLEELLSKSEIKDLEKFTKIVRACGKRFSLNNMSKLLKWYEKLEDTDLEEVIPYIDNVVDEAKEIQSILNVVKTILLIGAVLCAVFIFFGGFYYKPGLIIFGTVFVVIYCLTVCPIWMLFINLIAEIYLIIQAMDVKKANKAAAQA